MTKSFQYTLVGFLLLILTINCKAEEFNRDCWNENECIQGGFTKNVYRKLGIYQFYYKSHYRLLYYSKYAYAFCIGCFDNKNMPIRFLNKVDYINTKATWQRELPNYVLKRMIFLDKYLKIKFLDMEDYLEGNTHNIWFNWIHDDEGLEEEKQIYPNAKELSR